MGKLGIDINTNNQVYISNATLARVFLVAVLIIATFFLMQKFI